MNRDINVFTLIGRLTRDAEVKYTSGGLAVASFSVAVNRQTKQGEKWVDEPSFFDLSIFGKRAEGLSPYLLKAQQVAITGELKQDRWEKDGVKHSKVAFQVADLQLLGSGRNIKDKVPTEEPPKQAPAQGDLAVHDGPFEDDILF